MNWLSTLLINQIISISAEFSCPGFYRCQDAIQCIPPNQLCDGERQCPLADDEDNCGLSCNPGCTCQSLMVNCSTSGLAEFPAVVEYNTRLLNLNSNNISQLPNYSLLFPFMSKLYLSHNTLDHITPGTFKYMNNLLVLDLSYNRLTKLKKDTFEGLISLSYLSLLGNHEISNVESGAFIGLDKLPVLSLSEMKIASIVNFNFNGLTKLKTLDLSNNEIVMISDLAFDGISTLVDLNLFGNDIMVVKRASLEPLVNLYSLRSDHFKLCCMAVQVDRANCFPPQDPISSCEDLMNNAVLRAFIWILGAMAFIGNIFVVIWRSSFTTPSVPDIIITNLGVSDLLMGIYMLIIGGVDLHYQGVFIEYSDFWRNSWLCQLAGFLATFSSEASVMFLGLLTIDRFINILFPFSDRKLSKSGCKKIALIIWILGFIVSVFPLFPLEYFGENYYGRSGVCMALPITNERPTGSDIIYTIS